MAKLDLEVVDVLARSLEASERLARMIVTLEPATVSEIETHVVCARIAVLRLQAEIQIAGDCAVSEEIEAGPFLLSGDTH